MLSIWQNDVTLQSFADHEGAKGYPEIKHGTLQRLSAWAVERNQAGFGVYVTVNRTDGKGRKVENITGLRTWYTDIDGLNSEEEKNAKIYDLLVAPLPPSAIIKTKNGVHVYWFAEPNQDVNPEEFKKTVQGLAHRFGGDSKVSDISRVLRLPGYFHLKDPENSYLVEVAWPDSGAIYRQAELQQAYPLPVERKTRPLPPAAQRYVDSFRSADDWTLVLEGLAAWPAADGAKHTVLMQALGVALKFNIPQERAVADLIPIVASWNTREDAAESVRRRAAWAFKSGKPTTVSGLRNAGVAIQRLSRPEAA